MRNILQYGLTAICASLFFIVLINPAQADFNDLEVTGLSVKPTEPAINEPSTITVTVRSNGDTELYTTAGFTGYDINARNFSQTGIDIPEITASKPLKPERSVNYKIHGYFTKIGENSFGFEVNSLGQIIEYKTGNNYNYFKVNVVKQYDIAVKDIEIQPPHPVPGQKAYIKVTLKNTGFARLWTASGISSYEYSWQDFEQSSKNIPDINSEYPVLGDEEFIYMFNGEFLTAGDKTLTFTIDKSDQLDEKNEGNNTKTVVVNVFPEEAQDLAVESFSLSNNHPLIDEEVVITVKIKNTGDTSLSDNMGLLFDNDLASFPVIARDIDHDLADFEVTETTISEYPSLESPLEPGKTFTHTFTGFFTRAREQNLYFEININGRLTEADQANNRMEKIINVYNNTTDRDAFLINDYQIEFFTSESVRVNWQTSRSTSGLIKYKRGGYTNYVTISDNDNNTTEHSVTINNLDPSVMYDLIIKSILQTVTNSVDDLTFTSPTSNEIKLLTNPSAQVDNNSATINWETNLLTTTKVYYRNTGSEVDYKTAEVKNEHTRLHSLVLSELGVGKHEYYVVSENKAGEIFVSIKYNFVIISSEAPVEEEPVEEEPATPATEEPEAPPEEESTVSNTEVITNMQMYERLKGKIVLTVEANGEAYYINPRTESRHYLGRPEDAFAVMREQGVGITNYNLSQIRLGSSDLTGPDTDGDGLSNIFEDAIGTDKNTADTDSDGYDDAIEAIGGYNPTGLGNMPISESFASTQAGKIFLQVEGNGEAWYINPSDDKRYFLGRPADAFNVMRTLGLGISNTDFGNL